MLNYDLVKISGRLYIRDDNGNLILRDYEVVLHEWLTERSPKKFDTEHISTSLELPYDTIQPKLKWMATSSECPDKLRITMTKQSRAMGQRGRRKYMWSVE
jgi:hypothetical protein